MYVERNKPLIDLCKFCKLSTRTSLLYNSSSNTRRRSGPLAIPTRVFSFCFSTLAFYTIGHKNNSSNNNRKAMTHPVQRQ